MDDFVIAKNPDPDSTLAFLVRLPLGRDGVVLKCVTRGREHQKCSRTPRRITYRFTKDQRIILLTTFTKQRNNERTQVERAREVAKDCARRNP